jgi:hypothetical protein
MDSAGFQPLQLEQWREGLRKMSDEELSRFGRAALGMCSPEANFGHPPRSIFVDQLQESVRSGGEGAPRQPLLSEVRLLSLKNPCARPRPLTTMNTFYKFPPWPPAHS